MCWVFIKYGMAVSRLLHVNAIGESALDKKTGRNTCRPEGLIVSSDGLCCYFEVVVVFLAAASEIEADTALFTT